MAEIFQLGFCSGYVRYRAECGVLLVEIIECICVVVGRGDGAVDWDITKVDKISMMLWNSRGVDGFTSKGIDVYQAGMFYIRHHGIHRG
jgi:hypothetical protein